VIKRLISLPACGLKPVSSELLQAEQHQNLTDSSLQRLESLADQSAGPVYRSASKIERLRAHCDSFFVARDQQVPDSNRSVGGIDLCLNPATGGDHDFALTAFSKAASVVAEAT
jgi:hypothetical protein